MNHQSLSAFIWSVADLLRGDYKQSDELMLQASNNTKAQFSNSPTLANEIMNAVMDALAAHSTMSKQALESSKVREDMKDVLLGPGQLWEALRARSELSETDHEDPPT